MKNKMNVNGMDYVLTGDYYIPVLELPAEERSIGKYGRMYREYLKASDQMAWVRAMNSIYNRAEESILRELIYGEVAV